MTSAAAAASDGPRSDRIATLAHYPVQLGVTLFLLDLGSLLWAPPPVRLSFDAVLIAVFVLYWWAQVAHQRRRLCTKCSSGAPLDPQAAVAKRMRWLKLTHRLAETRLRWLPTTLMFVLIALSFVEINSFSLHWTGTLIWLVIIGPAALLQIHTPLQPWCPFCRWGRGDDGEEEPSPEPTPDPSIAPERTSTT